MKKKMQWIVMLLITFAIIIGSTSLMAQHDFGGRGMMHSQLTEDQRTQLLETVSQLRESNASREEIRAAVATLFESWGLEAPQFGQHAGFSRGMGQKGAFIDANTTAEQRIELYAKHDEMWKSGATHEEMRTAAYALLTSWGIELPDTTACPGIGIHRENHEDELMQEQRVAVRAKIKEMRIAGKSRKEIHDAVAEILKGFGVELPGKPEYSRSGRGHGRMGQKPQLTDGQRAALYAKQQELLATGATHTELRQARLTMLQEWGFSRPNTPRGDQPMRGRKHGETRGIQACNYPNPFNPQTNISYTLENAGQVKVSIFNLRGQELRVLFSGSQSAGEHTVRWDGKLANGESAGSGTYLYRIETVGQVTTNKMILMK